MAAALVSAFTRTPVRVDLAMSGEITLRGHVLPVGGVKEKVLAAYRAGIREVVLPEENEKDLEDILGNHGIELTICRDDACLLKAGMLLGAEFVRMVAPGEIVTCRVDLAMIHDSGGPRRAKPG